MLRELVRAPIRHISRELRHVIYHDLLSSLQRPFMAAVVREADSNTIFHSEHLCRTLLVTSTVSPPVLMSSTRSLRCISCDSIVSGTCIQGGQCGSER